MVCSLSLSPSSPLDDATPPRLELCRRGAAWRNVVQNAQQIRAWLTPPGSGGFARAFSACTGNSRRWEIGQPGKIIRELCAKSWKGDGQFPPERERENGILLLLLLLFCPPTPSLKPWEEPPPRSKIRSPSPSLTRNFTRKISSLWMEVDTLNRGCYFERKKYKRFSI